VGALAGRKRQQTFMPLRRSPLHDWAVDRGAIFAEAGLWKRSRAFPHAGESLREASFRETTQTRNAVGICDVSTLGKIDIQGPDAPEFLNRVYTNGWKRLAVGRARYGLMLREDGHVMDDGTTSCLAEGHYHMTTTTGQAPKVMSHLEWCLQALWTDLDVQVQSVTDQWAGLAVAGPNSRALLQRLLPDVDLSNAAFPFMGVGQYELAGGVPLRLFRISFSGELAYEVNVPADYGPALADKLLALGEDLGAIPYGLEALDVMRIEKGHVTAGELDGRTTAADLGMQSLMSSKKDYIGRVLSQRPGMSDPSRPRLVGLQCADGDERIRAGSHLLPTGTETTIAHDQGWVSSATWSPTFGRHIALGFLKNGAERMGEVVRAVDLVRGHDVEVEVVSPHFYDPEGTRQRG
jgi:sarcosine oxidase subunit alpha